ncbi:MAG: 5'/3'-nucleotidase SurE [Bacteroidetes bacterium]|nr:5'/3'-nucleotidase SurE [Bacteroidota bacterium]MBU1718174.1 5'/3'-nucleotidase SurE [Bacteroidota bacterium]
MKNPPLIFVTNDDGIDAPGLLSLIETVRDMGEVVVLAPENGQSGMSHALTVKDVLRVHKVREEQGLTMYKCNGTPVDCLKIARHKILDRQPDICLSGINHGSNSSINVIYSGTVAAALEGAMYGIPSVAFSIHDFSMNADFASKAPLIRKIVSETLKNKLPQDVCLNVNIPKLPGDEIRGIRICRQAPAHWKDDYVEREDPFHRKYYWLTGYFECLDTAEDTDEWALKNGYVSIVPVQVDFTDYPTIDMLKNWVL